MKRDMELIRELLLRLENHPIKPGEIFSVSEHDPEMAVEGFSADQIDYHLHLLVEAGLIESTGRTSRGILFKGLTWDGHEFLDSVRSPEVWAQTKKGAEKVGSFTIELLKDLAKSLIKKGLEDVTGLKL